MALNPNAWRVTSESDLDGTPYTKQEAEAGRISVVEDPNGERGSVVKLFRNTGDGLVNAGLRVEIARDAFVSEYALNTGGGWYYTSYMLGPEWSNAIASGELAWNTPPGDSKSALIKQFHPRNSDGFTHPIWSLRVSDRGVSLFKNALNDSDTYVSPKAEWPVDTMVWHDVVFGVVYNALPRKFYCFLDGRLVYQEVDYQTYPGATAGSWYSEGIYLPGSERDIETLSIYTQGYVQAYPGSTYSSAVGVPPISTQLIATREVVTRNQALNRAYV